MSRMRQIPVMDITQRERMLMQNSQQNDSASANSQPVCHPAVRPMQANCRPRVRKAPVRFRLSDTPALISNGCSSMREFCNSVQNITVDLNNLIGSVESMLPLLNTYVAVLQSRSTGAEQELEPPIEVTAKDCTAQPAAPNQKQAAANNTGAPQTANTDPAYRATSAPSSAPTAMPRPEDVQQLLENPLVRNLLNGFMQNGGFPK